MSNFENIGWDRAYEYLSGQHDPESTNYLEIPDSSNDADMTPEPKINIPYRIAHQIQEHIVHQVEMNDYYVGQAERDDMAIDLCNDWYNKGEFEPPELAFDALIHWRRIFRGHHG